MGQRPGRNVGTALRNRIPLMVIVIAGFLFVGGVAQQAPRTEYTAHSELFVELPTDRSQLENDQLVRFHQRQAESAPVLERASKALGGGETADILAKKVSTGLVRGASVIMIRARERTPSRAITLADNVAQAAIEENAATAASRLRASRTYLTDELARLSAPPASGASPSDLGRRDQYAAETYRNLQELNLAEARARDSLLLLESAKLDRSPSPKRYLAAAFGLGSVVAVFLALLLDRFDDRIFTSDDLVRATGAPLAVAVPATPVPSPSHALAAPYAAVFTSVMARHPDARVVMVTGASGHESAALAAQELGDAAVWMGRPALVLQIDPTLSQPVLAPSSNQEPDAVPQLILRSWLAVRKYLQGVRSQETLSDPDGITFVSVSTPLRDPAAAGVAALADAVVIVGNERATRYADLASSTAVLRNAGLSPSAAVLVSKRARLDAPTTLPARAGRWFRRVAHQEPDALPPASRRPRILALKSGSKQANESSASSVSPR